MSENDVQITETAKEESAAAQALTGEGVNSPDSTAPAAKSKINFKLVGIAGAVLLALIIVFSALGGKGYDKKAVKTAEEYFASNVYSREKAKLKDAKVEFKAKNDGGAKVDYIYIITGKVKGGSQNGKSAAVTVSVIGDGKNTNILANGVHIFESKTEQDEFIAGYKVLYR